MKNYAVKLVLFTTAFLIVFVIMSSLGFTFPVLFAMLVTCQILILYTVYKVLTDNFRTTKKFKDWYEDMPKKQLDRI